MKEFIIEYWLSLLVSAYLLGMVLHGHYRGFIRIAASVAALFASLLFVRAGMPYVTEYLKENTAIHTFIADNLFKVSGLGTEDLTKADEAPAIQRQIIESMNLPDILKEALIENNNNEVHQILGVQAFSEYVGNYLSNLIFDVIGFLLLFLISYLLLRVVMGHLNLFAGLPIVKGINQLAGAVLGGLEGLTVLWLLSLVVTICSGTGWGRIVILQIEASPWLTLLYRSNIFQWLIMGILNSMLYQA